MRAVSEGITFTSARTVTLRDEYLIAAAGSGVPREAIPAIVELVQRWADPPVLLDRIWELPTHQINDTIVSLCAAIGESRQVTGMLADALATVQAEEVTSS